MRLSVRHLPSAWWLLCLLCCLSGAWAQVAEPAAPAADPNPPAATGTAAPVQAPEPVADDAFTRFKSLYDYVATAPLNAQVASSLDSGGTKVELIRYESLGQTVPGYLLLPPAQGKRPVILLLNGYGGNKANILQAAPLLASFGLPYAIFCIDAPLHGDRAVPGQDFFRADPQAIQQNFKQAVTDYRRALDYLATRPELDSDHVAVAGVSLGAMLGTIVTALEPPSRVRTAVLAVGGANWAKILADSQQPAIRAIYDAAKFATGLDNPLEEPGLADLAQSIDPLTFAPHLGERPILIINAKDDKIIPRSAGEALQAAAVGSPLVKEWYDGGHELSPELVMPRLVTWVDQYD